MNITPARKNKESYSKYCERRKKEAILVKRKLRGQNVAEGEYVGAVAQYGPAFDKNRKMILPVFYVQYKKGVPFVRGPNHPKVIAAAKKAEALAL